MRDNKLFCPKCKCWLTIDKFYKDKIRPTGYTTYCKNCKDKMCEKARQKYYFRSYFNLTIDEYDKICNDLYKIQNGKCALCHKDFHIDYLRLDHNHETGQLRSLLCVGCNLFTGRVEKDLERVQEIINYLGKYSG